MKDLLTIVAVLLSPVAWAETAPSAQGAAGFQSFVPIILMFLIFYFLMIRPQQKRMKEEQSLLQGLQKNDEIFTKSGIIGTITGMTERVITLEISKDVRIKILRDQIGGRAQALFETKKEKK